MVIVESMLSHRIFNGHSGPEQTERLNKITVGLGRAASLVLFPYFWLKVIGLMHSNSWKYLNTDLGQWFLVEMIIFVMLPCFLFAWGAQKKNVTLIRFTAILTIIGIIINRLNVSIIAFNWNAVERYFPRWTEVAITIAIVTAGLLVFRWIVNRMPVLREHPNFSGDH